MSQITSLDASSLPADCYVFKHSTQCPISATAADEVRSFEWDMPLYWINVIEQRPLSNWVEAEFHVRHESPQLIAFKNAKPVAVLTRQDLLTYLSE